MSLAVGRERIHLRSRKKTTGTTAGHDMRFISKMLDKFPEMENFYIIMDNAPFRRQKDDMDEWGYKSIHLPLYSPELNPIEPFWDLLKSKVKRSQVGNAEDLKKK